MYQTLPSEFDGLRGHTGERRPSVSDRPLIAQMRRVRRSLQNA